MIPVSSIKSWFWNKVAAGILIISKPSELRQQTSVGWSQMFCQRDIVRTIIHSCTENQIRYTIQKQLYGIHSGEYYPRLSEEVHPLCFSRRAAKWQLSICAKAEQNTNNGDWLTGYWSVISQHDTLQVFQSLTLYLGSQFRQLVNSRFQLLNK